MAKHLSLSVLRQDPDRLLDDIESSEILGVSPSWFVQRRWRGTGPRFIKIGRKPYYLARDLLEFVEGSANQCSAI